VERATTHKDNEAVVEETDVGAVVVLTRHCRVHRLAVPHLGPSIGGQQVIPRQSMARVRLTLRQHRSKRCKILASATVEKRGLVLVRYIAKPVELTHQVRVHDRFPPVVTLLGQSVPCAHVLTEHVGRCPGRRPLGRTVCPSFCRLNKLVKRLTGVPHWARGRQLTDLKHHLIDAPFFFTF
jgi:hypothetical protein